ncbi:MAG: hypothetical protein LBB77_02915 [Treponema sp.]|jgi:hypothetical protein|nr:hypothetical protein [Treponema sp.]
MKRFWVVLFFGLFFPLVCFAQSQTGNASYNAAKAGFFISHPSLSFNTKVRVTNLNNNRSVEASVNGRIPITAERIADISRDTGDAIGMARVGLTLVKIEELMFHQPAAATPAPAPVPASQTPAPVPQTPVPASQTPVPAPQAPVSVPQTPIPASQTPAPVPQTPAPVAVVPAPVLAPQTPAAAPPAPLPVAAAVPVVVPPASPPPVPQSFLPAPAPASEPVVTAQPVAPPVSAVPIIIEEEYRATLACPVTNCANTPLLVVILILLILVIVLLVIIIVLILRRFPFLPKHYRVWLRRHVFFAKRRQK